MCGSVPATSLHQAFVFVFSFRPVVLRGFLAVPVLPMLEVIVLFRRLLALPVYRRLFPTLKNALIVKIVNPPAFKFSYVWS